MGNKNNFKKLEKKTFSQVQQKQYKLYTRVPYPKGGQSKLVCSGYFVSHDEGVCMKHGAVIVKSQGTSI